MTNEKGIDNLEINIIDQSVEGCRIEKAAARGFLRTVDEWLSQDYSFSDAVNKTLAQYHLTGIDQEEYRTLAGKYNGLKKKKTSDSTSALIDDTERKTQEAELKAIREKEFLDDSRRAEAELLLDSESLKNFEDK